MAQYTVEDIQTKVVAAAQKYNALDSSNDKITKVSLFGSYAEGSARADSDVDLLVSFDSSVVSLFTLAKVLSSMEEGLSVSVDIVQDPLPPESLLTFKAVIPLYERN